MIISLENDQDIIVIPEKLEQLLNDGQIGRAHV